jgi:hypothetical protein
MDTIAVTGIIALVAIIVGMVLGYLLARGCRVGKFTINYTDPAKDLCRLELWKDLDVIDKHHTITLNVEVIGKEET